MPFASHFFVLICGLVASLASGVVGFSAARSDNLAVYWGQDSAGNQQRLSFYCQDDTIDVIPMAFLYQFFGPGGQPVVDFANICSVGGRTFPGTQLADCSFMASDIQQCQAKGKLVTLSLGGGTANVGFNSDAQASAFADTIWNMFLGGKSSMRPFGSAILDGVDLDIENGSPSHYGTFVLRLRSHFTNASKKYYITAAPQCPFPDAKIGAALNSAPFDAVYVQFYNNYCETSAPSEFNFATWDHWARTQSPNPNVKVYLGAPGGPSAAGDGYVGSNTLINVAVKAQKQYPSFGGIMLWDADQAYTNNRYDVTVKKALSVAHGGSPQAPEPSPTPPPPPPPPPPSPAPPPASPTPPPASASVPGPTQPSNTFPNSTSSESQPTPFRDPLSIARVRRPTPITSLDTLMAGATFTPTSTSLNGTLGPS